MKDRKRIGAWILCISFVLILFVSFAYIVHEVNHDCAGEECDICETIAQTEVLLQSFALAGVVLLLFTALTVLKPGCFKKGNRLPVHGTLVSWKVRLDN